MRYQKQKSLFAKPKNKTWIAALCICAVGIGVCTYLIAGNFLSTDKTDYNNEEGEDYLWSGESPDATVNKQDQNQSKSSSSSQGASSQSTSSASQQGSSGGQSSQGASQNSSKPQFILPVSGEIINDFSGDTLVKDVTLGDWRTHNGIDIAAQKGSSVMAAANGTIKDIYDDGLWGTVVEIDFDGGYLGIYRLLGKNTTTKIGQKVSAGDVIGAVGEGAICESKLASHLHFEVKKDEKYVDPKTLID